MNHQTIYCDMCGFPVAYCQFRSIKQQKDFNCRDWLRQQHPDLFTQIYGEIILHGEDANRENKEQCNIETANVQEVECDVDDGEEGSETESEEGQTAPVPHRALKIDPKLVPPFGITIKPHIRNQSGYIPILQIRLASRGGRKWLTQIWNYVDFKEISAKEVCSALARQFAGAAGVTSMPDGTEEIMSLQGSFVNECVLFFEKLGIPSDQIYISAQQKHKGKKKDKKNPNIKGHQQRGQTK